jgi:hypothetical protein
MLTAQKAREKQVAMHENLAKVRYLVLLFYYE